MDKEKDYFWQYADIKKRIKVILSDYRKTVDYYYTDLRISNPEYLGLE